MKRIFAILLVVCVLFGLTAPLTILAAGSQGSVSDYATLLKNLKVLEDYSSDYAAISGKDAGELVINFLRTGVDRYNDGNWMILAGQEITAFVEYVEEQDVKNGTTAMSLRDIKGFKIPNGQKVDFGHMFGTMNIAYVNSGSADLGGWAGDICDLLSYSKHYGNVPEGTVEEKTAFILKNCFGVDADEAFGMDDFYGDMDAYYLNIQVKAGKTLSEAMEPYFTAELTDSDRAAYFLNNRFKGLETAEDVRNAIYETYTKDVGLAVLEANRGLSDEDDLRKASCYAFADYLYSLASDRLEGDTGEGGGDDEKPDEEEPEPSDNKYYSVFSSTASTLAPGVTQLVNFAYTADKEQLAYFVATVDVSRDDVTLYANYSNNDPSKGWEMGRVTSQMAAALEKHSNPSDPDNYIPNYNPVLGINADFYNMSTGKPSGALVMEGVQYNGAGAENFFAILKDGTPVIGSNSDWVTYADQVQEAVGGSWILIKDGELTAYGNGSYSSDRAPRSAVGITAEGKVVMVVVDGRQTPYSAGVNAAELAQIMLDAGCVQAMNLDGGGSSTFAAKAEGSNSVTVVNSPSDGYERSVSSSLMVVSTAVISNEFHHAIISTEYDYVSAYTPLALTAIGVSVSGHAAQIPEGAYWRVLDETIAHIEDGYFVCDVISEIGEVNDVVVELVLDDQVIGSKTIHVVIPDTLKFTKNSMNVIYGEETKLPLVAYYKGNPVAINEDEFELSFSAVNAADGYGFYMTAIEGSGIRAMTVTVTHWDDPSVTASMNIVLYAADEAMFDFDNVTGGNHTLAWDREITNTVTNNNLDFYIDNTNQGMEIKYTFALDMTYIEIPEQLAELTYMLPGADAGSTAWDFLLQLAERVSVLSEVRVSVQFSQDLALDYSNMKVSNEYFTMTSIELDEATNTLTIVANWIDQTQAIDPDTANPICILSGLVATPKDGAAWDSKNMLDIINTGEVSYDIYLRANALYNFSQSEANQKKYNLYPFINPDDETERGGHFCDTYATFSDNFHIYNAVRQGWQQDENHLFYYKDNKPLTGIHKVPGFEDPTKEYYYSFAEDGACNGLVSGLFELNGKLFYALFGELQKGWRAVAQNGTTNYYFFNTSNYAAIDGEWNIGGYNYTFVDCILVRGDLITNSIGTRYMWAGTWATDTWLEIDGKISYAAMNGYFYTGIKHCPSPEGVHQWYIFGDDGVWQQDANGLYDYKGNTYLAENGFMVEYPGLVKIGEYYYYFNGLHTMVKNCTYWISKPNGIMKECRCTFDEQGRLVSPLPEEGGNPGDTEDPVAKNGFVTESDGYTYYYVNGTKTYAGLIYGNGTVGEEGALYYVNSECKVIMNRTYWVSKTNGIMSEGWHDFDADGKLVIDNNDGPGDNSGSGDTEEPAVKHGFVEENGITYYYENGKKTYAGVLIGDGTIGEEGAYYYVNSSYIVIMNRDYWISKTNGLLPEKRYTFDETGKIVFDDGGSDPDDDPTEVKNGFVEENGTTYYYVNGVKTYAGLIYGDGTVGEEGALYYVNSECKVIKSRTYWVSKTNGIMPEGWHVFDADGKMVVEDDDTPSQPTPEVKNGFVKEADGNTYYYVNGVRTYAGLILSDGTVGEAGYYYYINSDGKVIMNRTYYVTKHNGLMKEGWQTFDEYGRMVIEQKEEEVVLNGFVTADDGNTYYYVDGVKTYAGLILVDGNYYYVNSSCMLIKNRTYWISKTNGIVKEGWYEIDENGVVDIG